MGGAISALVPPLSISRDISGANSRQGRAAWSIRQTLLERGKGRGGQGGRGNENRGEEGRERGRGKENRGEEGREGGEKRIGERGAGREGKGE